MDTVKAWAVVVTCVAIVLAVGFYVCPLCLNHWDKARASSRIEIKNMEDEADLLRHKRRLAGKYYGEQR